MDLQHHLGRWVCERQMDGCMASVETARTYGTIMAVLPAGTLPLVPVSSGPIYDIAFDDGRRVRFPACEYHEVNGQLTRYI